MTATLPDARLTAEYLDWLGDGHVQAVLAGGAASASLVLLEPDSAGRARVETRYEFPDRAAFDRYVREFAPRLRAEGVARFPPERGVTMERRLGVVKGTWNA